MEYVLGIDIGTGSVKAVAVNLECQAFEVSQQHYSFSTPKPGYYEQNPEEIWQAFKSSIKGIIAKTAAQPLAISLSSAMHSLIAVDKNCNLLVPMMTWADNRSAEIAISLRKTAEGMAIYKATGTPLHAMSPLCKLIWIRENDTVLFNKTHKFVSIKEYIWYRLFNEFKIDHSIASCTGLFNINQLTWHNDALNLASITDKALSSPVPVDYTKIFDAADKPELNFIKTGTPFIIGASDGCLASLGSMANKTGMAVMTIGTSGAVRIASDKPLPNEKAMTFSYILDKETFICGGPINNGGLALQWWLTNVLEQTEDNYEQFFEKMADIPAGSNGLIFLPYLTGERAPIWDSESCGTFFGVKLQHAQVHFSKAVLERICYAMKDVLDAVQQNAAPITQINVSGGFVRSAIWVQTLADLTGIDMVIAQTEDASAVGAALMAMKSEGLIKAYPTSDFADARRFKPKPVNTKLYKKSFKIFKQLYDDLEQTMHQLNELCS